MVEQLHFLLYLRSQVIRINTCGAALNEVVHEYHTLWIQAGAYFVLALVIYRFQIIRSRKMIIKQHRYMKMKQTF